MIYGSDLQVIVLVVLGDSLPLKKREKKEEKMILCNEHYQVIIIVFVYGSTLKQQNLPWKAIDAKTVK